MTLCIHTHCPSSKLCCQRYTCTRELRNRLERRRSERDQLKATLEVEATIPMKALRRLREECNKIDRDLLSRAKREYEDQASKAARSPKCFCAECAVKHKNREISVLRKSYRVLQMVQQIVADVQRQRECRERYKATTPSPRADVPPAWNKHARHATVQQNRVDMVGLGMMEGLPVDFLEGKDVILERVTIPGHVSR